ncbi:Tn3 family transposase (plasmid) [Candidatus Bandiella numerosa]|uniref:Tn3 family transposase n=1 Tax=Candidatus Bandiella numerosa TaxID=2570586 RepID=UPI00249DD6E8|nr:Tn3 family transposase [Candidatus Bandiella numerosa]WHA05711.1 Tn3 family transposase [Candidatus Bandiella numerosa]
MKENWNKENLERYWQLDERDQEFLNYKKEENKLICAVKIKYLTLKNNFPENLEEVPKKVLEYIAKNLKISLCLAKEYKWNCRLSRHHNVEIKNHLGYKDYIDDIRKDFINWLKTDQISLGLGKQKIIEGAILYLEENKILIPKNLEREVLSVIKHYEYDFFTEINKLLSKEVKIELGNLLKEKTSDNKSLISYLRSDKGGVSLETVLENIEKLKKIKALGIDIKIFSKYKWDLLKKYAEKVSVERIMDLERRNEYLKNGLLACFCHIRKLEIVDYLIDTIVQITHNLYARAERKADKALLKEVKKISITEQIKLLKDISKKSIENPKKTIEEVIYPIADKKTLEKIAQGDAPIKYKEKHYKFIHSSYSHHYRKMLSPILEELEFIANNPKDNEVLQGLELIKKYVNQNKRTIAKEEVPLDGIVPKNCREFICSETKVKRNYYEICLLSSLRDKLRCKEIWLKEAYRYRDPQEDVHKDFYERKDYYFNEIKQPKEAKEFIEKVKQELDKWMRTFSNGYNKNIKVTIELRNGAFTIKLAKSKAQAAPKNIEILKKDIQKHWVDLSLLDVVKEADLKINFTDELQSVGDREFSNSFIQRKRKILCVYGLGTNIGLKRASGADFNVSYDNLRHTQNLCITTNNIRNACTKIANKTLEIRDEILWGVSSTLFCASDASQFAVWDQNIMSEWHVRYGGKGVMAYWHTDKKSFCIYSQLKRCSSSEVASMIKGVIHHSTEAEVQANCVDTKGQNLGAFGFSYILNFDLLCRFKSMRNQKLFSPDKGKEYKEIKDVISRVINWELIEKYYEQIILYSVALKLKKAEPEALLKIFNSNNLKHPVYQAIQELGRAVKTIFLCKYLSSESLRREIHETLNVIERWNGVNEFIFYGKKGVISTNNYVQQELAILSLHLVQACMVYINTLMIQKVLSLKRWKNVLTERDKKALSPLIYEHINPYGRLDLDMKKRINFMVSDNE